MKSKILSYKTLVSLIFLVIVIVMSISTVSAAANSPLYVNDTSGSDDYDGTSPTVIDDNIGPMKHIQTALDTVDDDGEVNVAEGTYTESLIIKRNVTLKGSGSNQTTLNPASPDENVITIDAAVTHAAISGFTITGATSGNGIVNYGTGVTISDNNITNNGKGIVIAEMSEANITSNTITDNQLGLEISSELKDVHFNRIYHNENNIIATAPVNATYNWWGTNNAPEIENVLISPWIYMTFTVDPNIIMEYGTRQLVADFNNEYDGKFLTPLDPTGGHLPDGTLVTFTTDLGNVGSKIVNIGTINGIATATLTANEGLGTATVSAQLDQEILETTVEIINTLYVNGATGDDTYNGFSPTFISGSTGPLKTIQAAINKVIRVGTIEIASGTYYEHLTIASVIQLTLNGADRATTIIDGSNNGRIILAGNPMLYLNHLTLQNGYAEGDASEYSLKGGAIYIFSTGNVSISDSILTGNTGSMFGGAIFNRGTVSITDSILSGNSAEQGGAILSYDGDVLITNSTLSGNSATAADGGALFIGNGEGLISGSVLSGNSAITGGAAISSYNNRLNITGSSIINNINTAIQLQNCVCNAHFNRIIGDTININGGTVDIGLNWWGSNADPSTRTEGTMTITSWLVSAITATPNIIRSAATSLITIDLLHDNGILTDMTHPALYYHNPANGHVPDGIPVTFSTTLGTIDTTSTIVNGVAQVVLNGGIVSGIADVSSTVDDETVHAFVTVDTEAPNVSASPKSQYYNTNKIVTLTMNEPGTIYYTTDLQNPTTASTRYTGPITIAFSTILKFMGVDLAGNPSTTYMEAYIIDKVAPTVWSNIRGGYYNITKTIALYMSEPGTIYYTRNGSTPTTASTRYTGAITVSATTTLKFIAVDRAGNIAAVNTQKYIIDRTPPRVTYTYPKNLKTKQSRTTTLYLKFNENIKKSTYWSKIYVKDLKTGKKLSISKWIKGRTLYIKTKYKRASLRWYRVYIPYKAVRDLAGNRLRKSYTLKFKTRS